MIFISVVMDTGRVTSDPLLAMNPKVSATKSTIQDIDNSFGNAKHQKTRKMKKMFSISNHEENKSLNTKSTNRQNGTTQEIPETTPQTATSAHLFVDDFDSFFKAIPESLFEQTENEMMYILETEKEILANYTITNNMRNGTLSRPRRSALRNGYRRRLIRRNVAVICRRRCVWNNIWYFMKTGLNKNDNQACDC